MVWGGRWVRQGGRVDKPGRVGCRRGGDARE
jgi:hypothetical protein